MRECEEENNVLFNSFAFAIFLPIVFILYWFMPHKYRWFFLLISSYYFYMSWNPTYIILIFGTTVISYLAAIGIENTMNQMTKRLFLIGVVIVSLGTLFVFKYLNFCLVSLGELLKVFSIQWSPFTLDLLLPVGISFYTFQTMSYVIDVYRGETKAEKHFGYYATFISFFPQLVAGPIERTNSLLPQIQREQKFIYEKASDGLKLMLWGYYKKIVVADTIASYVDQVYDNLNDYKGFSLVVVIFLFSIQIYCDFSGYSDIAIGTAKLLGIDLMKNFDVPYLSRSVREFWKRWHISLSTWFRDYVYISLGGNRCSQFKHSLNLMITFLASGIWHGANWTYVVWGGIHGAAQILENTFDIPIRKIKQKKIGQFLAWLMVFVFCNMAWVFFRAQSISDAIYIFKNLFAGIWNPVSYFVNGFNALGISRWVLIYLSLLIGILILIDIVWYKYDVIALLGRSNILVRWSCYIIIALLVVLFSQKGVATEFVYFQF